MERILENLINFSINNTGESGKITLRTQKLSNEIIRFSIHDDGIQIPEKFREKIFKKFSQTEIKNDGYRVSRGLGLIFCKMAIEAHGGKMWLDIEKSKGNLFFIELPCIYDV